MQFSNALENLLDYEDVAIEWNMSGDIQLFLNSGLTSLEEGKLRVALQGFDRAISLDSTLWVAYYYRGITYKLLHSIDKAKSDLLKASRLQPKISAPHMELGRIFLLENNLEQAESHFKKSKRISPDKLKSTLLLGDVYAKQGDLLRAEKMYNYCNRVDPDYLDAQVRLGLLETLRTRKIEAGLYYFDRVIAKDSVHEDALFLRAISTTQTDKKSSLRDFHTLIRNYPANISYQYFRGNLLVEEGDFENAFSDFRRVLIANQDDERNFRGFQTQLDKKLDLQFAINYADRNMYGLPEHERNKVKKAFSLYFVSRYYEGIEELKKVTNYKESPLCLFLIGVGYEHIAQHEIAWTFYKSALRFDNEITDAHKKSGIYYTNKNDWKMAEKEFSAAANINPDLPIIYKLRGVSRFHLKNYVGAIEDFTQFLQSDSLDSEALSSRAFAYDKLNEQSKAMMDRISLKSYKSLDFKLIQDHLEMTLEKGDTLQAMYYLNKYTKDNPVFIGSLDAFILKLEILLKQNNWVKIPQQVDSALNIENHYGYVSREKEFSFIYWVKGLQMLKSGNENLAETYLNKSIMLNSKNANALLERGTLYFRQRKFELAKKDLSKAADLGKENAIQLLANMQE